MADCTEQLRQLLKIADISSFKQLSLVAKVSLGKISKLRRGQADLISYRDLDNLGNCLKISVEDLIERFSKVYLSPKIENNIDKKLENNSKIDREQWQQEVLTKLEALILQLPTAVYALSKNPDLPARNLLPLLQPIQSLLKDWQIEPTAIVGSEIDFDPCWHQSLDGADFLAAGAKVLVRYTGYAQGDRLLYRARVSRVKTGL